jgi:oligosaccharide amylase
MPVYLPTAVLGNSRTLLTLGHSGEIMGWFYPHKDHAQNIYQCMPCAYIGEPHRGNLHWTYDDQWQRHQWYEDNSNICITELTAHNLGIKLRLTDVVPPGETVLLRRVEVENIATTRLYAGIFHYGDWNMGGIRMGNSLRFDRAAHALVQNHRETALVVAGDALQMWQCGKAGAEWGSNAMRDLDDGALAHQDLEIGDVNWSCGFNVDLHSGDREVRTLVLSLADNENLALQSTNRVLEHGFEAFAEEARQASAQWLAPGLKALEATRGEEKLPADLAAAYRRSLLCLPLLCGPEGAAVAAPEFDPEFISCGGYGYHWPRDGGEYVSGLMDAGYNDFASPFFDWCARHQDASGLWHQRYFLNGAPGPNWCLPPDMLQIDQVGAVLWALGKATGGSRKKIPVNHQTMTRLAADYLLSRLTEKGVHGNAFDTWETFVGSFTYSNAAIYAAFKTAARVLGEDKYEEAAQRVKNGVMQEFVRDGEYPYLVRGLDSHGQSDDTVDSASLGAIEPFELLDLKNDRDLAVAEGTLRAVTERLDVEWMGGRAIRRFEGDAYVGGVPACVNTLWMARCCLKVANRLYEIGRNDEAKELTQRAQVYLQTVLRRATPTGLLPELMQGPTGQTYWAAPHGWAMSSFVSGTLMLAKRLAKQK